MSIALRDPSCRGCTNTIGASKCKACGRNTSEPTPSTTARRVERWDNRRHKFSGVGHTPTHAGIHTDAFHAQCTTTETVAGTHTQGGGIERLATGGADQVARTTQYTSTQSVRSFTHQPSGGCCAAHALFHQQAHDTRRCTVAVRVRAAGRVGVRAFAKELRGRRWDVGTSGANHGCVREVRTGRSSGGSKSNPPGLTGMRAPGRDPQKPLAG